MSGARLVVHKAQDDEWDCGLACCSMVLLFLGKEDLPHSTPSKFLWTIDIHNFLHQRGVAHQTYYTAYPGVNPAHSTLKYYTGSHDEDEARVNRLFTEAPTLGLSIQETTPSLEHIVEALAARRALYIALVDANLLQCTKIKREPQPVHYQGHYILLCGFDASMGLLVYMNPQKGSCATGCTMTTHVFEAAWRAQGTDCDLIEIGGF
jgi:hypothetical protein